MLTQKVGAIAPIVFPKYVPVPVEINRQDLEVCKSCKLQIQVIEGRDNGRQRPEMGPRPGPPGAGAITFQNYYNVVTNIY